MLDIIYVIVFKLLVLEREKAEENNIQIVNEITLYSDDEVQVNKDRYNKPNETVFWDCGAASVLVSKKYLCRYLALLMAASFDIHTIPVWSCLKGCRFRSSVYSKTKLRTVVLTCFSGE